MSQKYRLITRSDFDGLVCAMILKELDMIDDIKFVHPKDMQDGKVKVTSRDISTNLPYVPGVHLSFDHHLSEKTRMDNKVHRNHIFDPNAPSAARLVYEYFNGSVRLKKVSKEIMAAVDKSDSARFTKEDVLNPSKWVLLNYIMDARSGFGRFKNFRISNYQLMMELIGYCLEHPVDKVLQLPDVKERVDMYFKQQELFKKQIKKVHKIEGDVVVLYLKDEDVIYTGNRFMVYAMYPQAKISVHVMWGYRKQNTAITIGKSILNKSSNVNIGDICLEYGGGGHRNAGTCQIPNDKVDEILPQIIKRLNGK